MREQGSLLGFVNDPRLAPYAMGDIPAWLWSADATRILWGNPPGAAPRLERLRGFGGRMGGALMCGCSRILLADGTPAILVAATEAAGKRLSRAEQAQRLLAGGDEPLALFEGNGTLLHATPAA